MVMYRIPNEKLEEYWTLDSRRWKMYLSQWKELPDGEWMWDEVECYQAEKRLLDEIHTIYERIT